MTRPIYDLGAKYYQSHEDIIKKDDDAILQKHFQMNERRIRDDFKTKISNLAKYYKELNDQYTFSTLDKEKLLEKVIKVLILHSYSFSILIVKRK